MRTTKADAMQADVDGIQPGACEAEESESRCA